MKNYTPLTVKGLVLLLTTLLISTSLFSNSFENYKRLSPSNKNITVAPITSFTPLTGYAGIVVTINDTGGGFTNLSTVTLNGVSIPGGNINFIDINTLEVTIPCGATTGKFSVDVGADSTDTFTVNSPPVPVSNGDITECQQSPIQTLDANDALVSTTNIIWYTLASGGSVVPTPTLNTVGNITYYAEYDYGGCSSLTRTAVTLTIDAAPAAPTSLGDITECETSPIQTLNANDAFASTTGITWYTAATAGTVIGSPTFSAVGSITYYAEYSDGTCSSLTRTAVTLTITAAPAAPTSLGDITECQQSPIQTLNANDAFASTTGITWYTLASGGSVVPTPTLNTVGNITYYAEYSDGTCSSLTRTAVTLTITAAPAAPTSLGDITECETSPIQTLNANDALVSTTGIIWYTLASGGSIVPTPTLNTVGNITYYAEYSDGTCSSLTRTAVTLTIDATPAAPTSLGDITECETSPIQTLNANDAFASTTGITWYTLASGGSVVPTPTLNTVGNITYYAEYDYGGCSSLTRTAVTLTITAAPAAPTSLGDITECQQSPIQTLNANDAFASTTGITWYTLASGGSVVPTPTLNTVGNITYYAEYSDGTCSSLTRTVVTLTITAAPPAPTSNGDITECQQSPIQTLDANDALVSTTGVTWYDAATAGAVVGSPTLSAVGNITYYAEYNNGTCDSLTRTAVTLTITAAPPAPTSNGDITECQQSPIQTLDANDALVSAAGVTWYTAASGGTVVGSPTLSAVGNITYYAEYNNGTCDSLTRTAVTLTITATPILTSPLTPPTICSGSPFVYTPTSDIPGTSFTWSRAVVSGISNAAGSGSGNINEVLTNITNSTVSVTYDIVLTTGLGCTNTVSIVVDIDPVPDAATTISGTQTVCDGSSGNVYTVAPILNATSYIWTLPNASTVSTATNSITVNYLVGELSGNLSVLGRNSCGDGIASANYPITIIPPPTLSSSLTPAAVCSGQSFSYGPTSTVTGATFSWVRNAVAGISNIAATGTNGIAETLVNTTSSPIDIIYTYTIKTPSPELCENTQNVTVRINPLPTLTSSTTPPDICSGTIFNYIPTSSVSGTTFSWTRNFVTGIAESTSSNNPGNISETLTNTTDTTISVTYIISQTTPDGCTTTPVNIVVDVDPIPLNASIISGPTRVCAGSTNNVYTITTLQNVDKYVWTLPNGSTVETPTPTITLSAMAGTLNVHARNSCGNGGSSNLAISIIAAPTLSSSLTPADICSGTAFVYLGTSNTAGATFSWTRSVVSGITNSFGSGVGAAVNEVLTNETSSPIPVVYTFTITTPEGCENTQDVTVIVSSPVPPDATVITGPQSICTGSINHVYTVDPILYATSYEWTLPNLSTVTTTNPTITFNSSAGTLSVFGRNSCGDGGASNLAIAVIPAPTLTSTLSPADLCSGDTFEYTPASITFGATFSWTRASVPGISNIGTSGNGAITPASNETLINTTNTPIDVIYIYTITTLEGCQNSQNVTVTVNPLAILTSSLTPPDICSGTTFNYSPTTSIVGTTFTWTRAAVVGISEGNNSGATDINEVLTNETSLTIPVTYVIIITTGDGCSNTQTITVDVTHEPLDATTISGSQRVCTGSTGNVFTIPTITNATSYVWTLPNTLIVETVLPTITIDAMSGNLSVHGKNSCGNGVESSVFPITIVGTPTLTSDLTPPDICSGDSFEYVPTSLAIGATFSWTRAVVTGISNSTGAGSGAITPASNEILINETTTPKNVVYSFTTTTPEGCENTEDVTVVVNPSAILLSSLTPPASCSGTAFSYPLASSIAGTTFAWTRADIIGISEPSSSGTTDISEILTNTTTSTISVTYAITLTTGNGCSNTVNVVVDIEPAPFTAGTINGLQTVCAGSVGNVYTVTPITNATSYEWTLPDASTVITTSNSISINYSLTDISGNLSVHGVNSCNNGTESAVLPIIVIAPPTLSSSATPADICSEQPFTYTPTSTVSGATFSWARAVIANISNPASFGTDAINETLVNTSTSPVNVVYTYTITTPQGCENTDIVTVIVNPLPTLTSILTPAAICSGSTFSYTATSSQAGTIAWSRAAITGIDEGSNSGTGAINEILTNTTGTTISVAYDLTLPTTGNGCSNIVTIFVDVESAPSAATVITGSDEVCAGSTDNIYTVTAIPNATSYVWTLPNASTVTTTLNSISIDYSLTDISGNLSVYGVSSCGNGPVSPVLPIIIIAPPTLSSSATPADICSEQSFTYTPTSTVSGATFSWARAVIANISNPASFGVGAINETLVNTSTSPVNVVYTYTITTPQGCENTDIVTVIVNPLPTLTSTLTPDAVCSGSTFSYTPTSSQAGTIAWSRAAITGIDEGSNSGTGTISEALTNTTGTTISVAYDLTLPTTGNGCSNVVTIFVDVESAPSTATVITGSDEVCAGSTDNVYTVTAIPNATSYVWTLPDASTVSTTSNSISINYSLTDISGNLSVHGLNSCGNGPESPALPIIIIAPPTLSSSVTPTAICSKQPFNYTPTSTVSGATFSWTREVIANISNPASFGIGAINESLVNTSSSPVNVVYTYTITTPQGCENTAIVTVVVNPSPLLTSTVTPPAICSGDTFTYIPTSSTDPITIIWTRVPVAGISGAASGTGNISDLLTNTTGSPIAVTYELVLTPTGPGCTDTVDIVVQVNPLPTATISGGGNTCLNSTDNLIVFTGANGTAPYTFTYNIGGIGSYSITTTSGNSIAVPSSSSTLGTLIVYNLVGVQDASSTTCSQTVTGQSVPITVSPTPNLVITNPTVICENETVDLTDPSITAGSEASLTFTYWTNSTATTEYFTPTAATEGTYYIMATNSNGCSIIEPVIVTVNPIPTVTVNSPTICIGETATISATPSPPGLYDYSWTVPSGASAPGNVPSFTTTVAGTYTVTISNQATPLCVSVASTGTVTINPLPTATISSDLNVCIDNFATVTFTGANGTTPYIFTYNINGGTDQTIATTSGNSITLDAVTSATGIFNYNLISVSDSSLTACSQLQTGTSVITISDIPVVNAGGPILEVCAGELITLTGSGADSYTWDYGVLNGIAFLPPQNTPTTYTVTGTSNGCTNTDQIQVIVNPLPSATITGINSYEVCKDAPEPIVTFTGVNGTAPYLFTYEISSANSIAAGASDPITYTVTSSGNSANVPIVTNITDIYTVTLVSVEDASSTNCLNSTITEPSTATITILESGIEPQPGTPFYQTVCEGIPISQIAFNITSTASASSTSIGAIVEGLPAGVNGNFEPNTSSNGGTLFINGTPTESGIFPYTIVTTGVSSDCDSSTTLIHGTIEVNQKAILTPLTPTTTNQSVCENSSIQPILYRLEGSATGANVTGLPAGLSWSITGDILTISGDVTDASGDYLYKIESQGICDSIPIEATITINQNDEIQLTNGEAILSHCINTPLLPEDVIKYTANSPLDFSGFLPSGLSFDPTTGEITGTPTESGTFSYTISTTSGCSNTLSGQIIISIEQYISHLSGDQTQIACINTSIEPIIFNVENSVTLVTFTPALPAGIVHTINEGVLEIIGTPTVIGTTSVPYIIKTTNSCSESSWSGMFTLEIIDIPTIDLETVSGDITQTICQGNEIEPILFTLNGADGIDPNTIPSWATILPNTPSTGIYELTGIPTNTGPTNFQLKTSGGTNTCVGVLDVSIDNLSASVAIQLTSDTGTDSQVFCQSFTTSGNTIIPIEYSISGATDIEITGLPAGVFTNTFNPGIIPFNLIISGTPTQSGIFNYEIKSLPCGTIKSGVITISSPMAISANVTQVSCNGNDGAITVDITGGTTTDDGLYAIEWTGPNGFRQNQPTITGLVPGDYIFGGTDAIGCGLPTQTFTIDFFEPLAVNLLSITSPSCGISCANFTFTGGSSVYTSFLLNVFNPSNKNWEEYVGGIPNYYNICGLEIGLYELTVFDSEGCNSEPYQFTIVSEGSLSIIDVSIDENLCNGSSGRITVEMNSIDPDLNFYYNDVVVASTYSGDNIYELILNESGLDGFLKVINSENCSAIKLLTTETVQEIDLDFEFDSIDQETPGYFEVNSAIQFTNLLDIGLYNTVDYNYIVWDFDDNTPFKVFYNPDDKDLNANGENIETVFHSYTNDGIYDVTLTVYNNAGCSISITKTIVVGKGATIMLPTVFSPNSDGVNDFFGPSFNGVEEITMYIYDNWGNLVYEISIQDVADTNNMGEFGWNGIEPVNSEPKNEAYRCFIIAKTIDGKTIEKTGRFLIIQ